ncbi:hypothetical protein [Agromyces albus]|uniref:DUF3817 domain-containing protein n=1 Tax=Agromyces albus TaxID=205332 RepID=A0A4Q2L976_9MICO|nr:hypothetical protein [Agromyces albus]RXZ72971.1 hypothetical protein ESP51_01740 [Agromyces albus]
MRPVLRAFEVLSILELASVALLLANLATLHLRPITATMGPTHGALYLAVVVTALFGRDLLGRTRWMALIPVLGGALTLWNVRLEARRVAPAEPVAD